LVSRSAGVNFLQEGKGRDVCFKEGNPTSKRPIEM
jgi:hypothetical protein